MSIPAPPDVRDLPTTPSRANAADGDVFSSLMDSHLAALPLWSGDLEALGQWTFARATDIAQAVQQVQNIETNVSTLGDQKIQAASQQADRARDEADRAGDEADRAQSVADNVAAQTNFKGLWEAATGPASWPASYLHNFQYWNLLKDMPDITSVEPGTDDTVWAPVELASASIGELVYSTKDLSSSGFLPLDQAATYLQSAYPALFALTGLGLPQFSGIGAGLAFPGGITPSIDANMLLSNTGAFLAIASASGNAVYILETSGWTLVHTINTTLSCSASTPNVMSWSYNDEYFRIQDGTSDVYRVSDWTVASGSTAFMSNFNSGGNFGLCFSPTERKAFGVDASDFNARRLVEFNASLSVTANGLVTGLPTGAARRPVFNHAGTLIASDFSGGGKVFTPEYATTVQATFSTSLAGVSQITWSPDDQYVAAEYVFDAATGVALGFPEFALNARDCFWSPDSKTVFVTERTSGEPAITAYDIDTLSVASDVSIPNGVCTTGVITQDNQYMIYMTATGLLSIAVYPMDPNTEFYLSPLAPINLDSPSTVSFTPYIKAEG